MEGDEAMERDGLREQVTALTKLADVLITAIEVLHEMQEPPNDYLLWYVHATAEELGYKPPRPTC